MSFADDLNALNTGCLDIADSVVWMSETGPVDLKMVVNTVYATENADGYEVKTTQHTAEGLTADLAAIKRGDQIVHNGDHYEVIGNTPEGNGWSILELDR